MKKTTIPLPFLQNFIKCGTIGWCMEITFTALGALRRRELPLIGQTSLWMFPIYGCAAFFQPAFLLLRHCHLLVRGTVYALSIFGAEYTSGRFLKKHELCPWNYNRCRWHVNGLIRIDFFPSGLWRDFCSSMYWRPVMAKTADTARHGPQCSAIYSAHSP